MYQQVKFFAVAATVLVLAACQTTPYITKREVDPSETLIRFPVELNDVKGFRFKGATIQAKGSHERQTVYFTGGWFAYERYFFGGFRNITQDSFLEYLTRMHDNATHISSVKTTRAPVGLIHYATFKNDGASCFFMMSNYGASVGLKKGRGTEGLTAGSYCASGEYQNLETEILSWLKKIRLDHS